MAKDLNRRLLENQKAQKRQIVRQMTGLVTDDSPFTVRVRGTERTGLVYLAGYLPTIGDRVLLVQKGNEAPIVLGKLGGGVAGQASPQSISRIEFYGHSGTYGGASNAMRGTDTRLAGIYGAEAVNRTRGGSRLSWHEPSSTGLVMVGGWAHVYRYINPGEHTWPYDPRAEVVNLWYGQNDLPQLGPGDDLIPFTNALEAVISRARATAVYEATNASVTYPTGTWTTAPAGFGGLVDTGTDNLLIASGGSYKYGASGTIRVVTPSSFPGGDIALAFFSAINGGGAAMTFTLNGNAAGSLDTRNANAVDYGESHSGGTNAQVTPAVKRFTGLAPGTNTIVVTVGSVIDYCYFDCWWIEAQDPPIVTVCGGWRTGDDRPLFEFYDLAGFPYVPDLAALEDLNDRMRAVCDGFDEDVIFVPVDDVLDADPDHFTGDAIHPNDRGHALVAAQIASYIDTRAKARVAQSKAKASAMFVTRDAFDNQRNVIEAVQPLAAPLTLRGRKAGDQLEALLLLDGRGSYPLIKLGRDVVNSGTSAADAGIVVPAAAGQFLDDSEAGDLVAYADVGQAIRFGEAGEDAMLVVDADGVATPEAFRWDDGSHQVRLGQVFGLPAVVWDNDVTLVRSAADELTLAAGDHLKTDDPEDAQDVATKNYVDEKVPGYTRWMPDYVGNIAAGSPTANRAYFVEVFVRGPAIVTGIEFRPFNATGSVKAILYDSSGAILAATSAGVALTGSGFGTNQQVAFSAPEVIEPGTYLIGLAFNNASSSYTTVGIAKRGGAVDTSYTTPVDPITPPTGPSTTPPYMHLY